MSSKPLVWHTTRHLAKWCINFTYSYTSISNFTLNLQEDSGWYRVNYAAVGTLFNYELFWGKGESHSHESSHTYCNTQLLTVMQMHPYISN